MKEAIKEAISELCKESLTSFGHWLTNISYTLALVGGSIAVLMYVCGWSKGMKCTGLLVLLYTLLKGLAG